MIEIDNGLLSELRNLVDPNNECCCEHCLANKCKEWALGRGYRLISFGRECFLYEMQELYDVSEQLNQWSEWFEADTELEAVLKACGWIRNKIREEK